MQLTQKKFEKTGMHILQKQMKRSLPLILNLTAKNPQKILSILELNGQKICVKKHLFYILSISVALLRNIKCSNDRRAIKGRTIQCSVIL